MKLVLKTGSPEGIINRISIRTPLITSTCELFGCNIYSKTPKTELHRSIPSLSSIFSSFHSPQRTCIRCISHNFIVLLALLLCYYDSSCPWSFNKSESRMKYIPWDLIIREVIKKITHSSLAILNESFFHTNIWLTEFVLFTMVVF